MKKKKSHKLSNSLQNKMLKPRKIKNSEAEKERKEGVEEERKRRKEKGKEERKEIKEMEQAESWTRGRK